MKLDQLYIPKIKIPCIQQKQTGDNHKKCFLKDELPKLCSPLKSETERACILKWPRSGYIAKRAKGEIQQLRSKSFKTPTNMCQQNLIEFQNKRNTKNLAIEIRKIDEMKREIIKDTSLLSKKLGADLLKISTDSLIYRDLSDKRERKVKKKDKEGSQQAKLTDKLINELKYHFTQKYYKDQHYLRKKYAQLTFHQIIESESDEEENHNRQKAERRKVKTQMSNTSDKK